MWFGTCSRQLSSALWLAALVSCSSQSEARGPRDALQAYAAALQRRDLDTAYRLLSSEAKKSIPFDAFQRMVTENPEEVRDIIAALSRPAGPPRVTALITTPDGQTLLLVYEDGAWKVDGAAIDLYSQATPRAAVAAFVRALDNRRYDILMRFVPESKREGLNAQKLKNSFEGEQREEMDKLTQALKAALPTAEVELLGDRATMAYGAGGTVELVREHGLWKVEDFQ
ncbi:MAG TPA: hypothetical protein VGJ84_08370 [Polyangiaceae bacterium]